MTDGAKWARSAPASETEARIARLEAAVREAKADRKEALARLDEQREHLRTVLNLRDSIGEPKPIKAPAKRKHRFAGVQLGMLSDLHVEERIRRETVSGMNEYTPTIAEARLTNAFQGFAWEFNQNAQGYSLDTFVLWIGGDTFSGWIHEELVEQNFMSPLRAVRWVAARLRGGIEYLKAHAAAKIVVICNFGNHGRNTVKRRSSGADTSLEFMMYCFMADAFQGDARVRFEICEGSHLYVETAGHVVRFTHGDDANYQGGVGGISIPIRRALNEWDKARRADLTVMGHFHQCNWIGRQALVNGSLIGYGPYAISIKAGYEPPCQLTALIDADRGVRRVTPIMVEPKQMRWPEGRVA